jgi:Protein of unknown function (DUF3455)
MAPETSGRVGVLVVRAWRDGSRDPLRIRVMYRPDVLGEAQMVAAVSTAGELFVHVREWLDMVGGCASARPPMPSVSEGEPMTDQPRGAPTRPYGIPAELRVPDGYVLFLRAYGTGVQIYNCPTSPRSAARPHAVLFEGGRHAGTLAAIHYAGPTWEAPDGSRVSATRVASVRSPYADGVDWLLLKANGHQGTGRFSKVVYIQRIHTDGGRAPAVGCSEGQIEVMVEYSAEYLFYVAEADQPASTDQAP